MFAEKPTGSDVGVAPGKNDNVVDTIATVGPAARKLHLEILKVTQYDYNAIRFWQRKKLAPYQSIAMQMSTATDFLYH